MKIYTKTGDDGKTSFAGGERVWKTHPLIEAYGTVDELNAILGFVGAQVQERIKWYKPLHQDRSEGKDEKRSEDKSSNKSESASFESQSKNKFEDKSSFYESYTILLKHICQIQDQLFHIGSHLACRKDKQKLKLTSFDETQIKVMEDLIDKYQTFLPHLKNFILPGGSLVSASFHLARTICRRAERAVLVAKVEKEEEVDSFILKFLNRLSDFLFILARYGNYKEGVDDILWKSK